MSNLKNDLWVGVDVGSTTVKIAVVDPETNKLLHYTYQRHNAMALVRKEAAILIKDADATEQLIPQALALTADTLRLDALHNNILTLAQRDSAKRIAEEVIKLARRDE